LKTSYIKLHIFLFLLLSISFAAFPQKGGVTLSLDYSKKKNWEYEVEYHSNCIFLAHDTGTIEKKTSVKSRMNGISNKAGDTICFSLENIAMNSKMYSEEASKEITQRLSLLSYCMYLNNGCPLLENNRQFTSDELPEWSFFMQIVKLLPQLPGQPVLPGFEWEEDITIPVSAPGGDIQCNVYREFVFDKLSSNRDTAYLDWSFIYARPENVQEELTGIAKMAPIYGKGRGRASLDLKNRCITRAEMQFETPVTDAVFLKMYWKEKALLTIAE
jgi:hypothetical protein